MIMVVMMLAVLVMMRMCLELLGHVLHLLGMMVVAKDEDRCAIDDETEDGHQDRLVELNLHRRDEPQRAFLCHHQREAGEQHGARVATQRVDLASAEAEVLVMRMAARIHVGNGVDG